MGKVFQGNKVVIGCSIYMFCILGILGTFSAGYSLFPEAYGISVGTLGLFMTFIPVTAFLTALGYATVVKKIMAKGCLYIGIVAVLVIGLLFMFVKSPIGFAVSCILNGLLNSFCTFTVITQIISSWYVKSRATKLALAFGCATFGMAAYQLLGGYLFAQFGLGVGFLIITVATAVILLITTKFLIVANTPEEVGQTAFGGEETQEATAAGDSAAPVQKTSLYKNPAFWFGCASRLVGAGSVIFVSQYATMFFTSAGMELSLAATLLSVMTLASALFALVSGKLLETIKTKPFMLVIFTASVGANLSILLYGAYPSVISIIAMIVLYGIGFSTGNVNSLIVDKLFEPQDTVNANSKFYATMFAGNIFFMASGGIIIERLGFNLYFLMMGIMSALSLIFFFMAIAAAKKRGRVI